MESEIDQTSYQHMTRLPEELERKLLDVPMAVLLTKCGLLFVSDKYTLVQRLATTLSEAEVRKIAERRYTQAEINSAMDNLAKNVRRATDAGEAAPATSVKGISGRVRQPLLPENIVKLKAGSTRIQPGSLRDKVLKALRGRERTIAQLSAQLGFDAKPVVSKLREAGWVEVI
jgi:hypothetical protein